MFDRVNIKAVVIVTSLAAIVSIAAGGIGGVSMGTLLVRALISALLFGLGALGINILIDTFLPELTTPSSTAESTDEEGKIDERGQNIDIVMDDDQPAQGGSHGDARKERVDPSSTSEAHVNVTRPERDDFQPTRVSGSPQGKGEALPDIGEFTESIESEDEDDIDEVDSSDATSAGEASVVTSRFGAMQTSDDDQVEFFQNNTTSEDMARGVRTMLKRDEKG